MRKVRPTFGNDHADNRAVVGDVEACVEFRFVLRSKACLFEVRKPGNLVIQTDDKAVDRADGTHGDIVGTVVGLFLQEDQGFFKFVSHNVVDKSLADLVDKFVRNV